MYLEKMKEYHKEVIIMKKNYPKLYAVIIQCLSEESLVEVKRGSEL
jgi:hypothetical protein